VHSSIPLLSMADNVHSKPFDRSYLVVPGLLLAGCYPGAIDPVEATANLEALLSVGILTYVDLTEQDEVNIAGQPLVSYEREWRRRTADAGSHRRKPIRDRDIPSSAEMKAILDLIDSEIQGDRPVYVHCLGGIGRNGTVVGCWLARHGVAAGSAVLDHIQELRIDEPYGVLDSPETEDQREMVRKWQAGE